MIMVAAAAAANIIFPFLLSLIPSYKYITITLLNMYEKNKQMIYDKLDANNDYQHRY